MLLEIHGFYRELREVVVRSGWVHSDEIHWEDISYQQIGIVAH